jgi:hypothetical protein
MTNDPMLGSSSPAVMGALLTDVRTVLSSPRGKQLQSSLTKTGEAH